MNLRALPIKALIVTLVAIAILINMGLWQLERAEYKRQRTEQLKQRQSISPLSLQDINKLSGDIRDYPLALTGRMNSERIMYWDNRVLEGQVGYEVLVPLKTDRQTVLINLGWIPAPSYRDQLPEITLPDRKIEINGIITRPEGSPLTRQTGGSEGWPKRLQHPDIDHIESLLGQSLADFIVQVAEPERFGLVSNYRPVTMSAERHIGYAVQWFGLALAALVVFLVAIYKRHHKKR